MLQEKKEREQTEELKQKEKEKISLKEPVTKPAVVEKEVKVTEITIPKSSEPVISPKKIPTSALPISRHRVNS